MTCSDCSPRGPVDRPRREAAAWGAAAGQFANFATNLAAFNTLAANFGQSPRDFAQGDFNYDGTVNLSDFNILASRFGRVLGPPAVASGPGAPTRLIDELDV